jgi:DNA-binding NarL/FixJ family response regulator
MGVVIFCIAGVIFDKYTHVWGFMAGFFLMGLGQSMAFFSSNSGFVIPYTGFTVSGNYTLQTFTLALPIYFSIREKGRNIRPQFGYMIYYSIAFIISTAFEIIKPSDFTGMLGVVLMMALSGVAMCFALFNISEKSRRERLIQENDSRVSDLASQLKQMRELARQPDESFTKEEQQVAILLLEGSTQHEIARKFRMTSGDVGDYLASIRQKIGGADLDSQSIVFIVKEYALTKRETDMLRCLCKKMTNSEIAEELTLSEETVRTHVRNLMKKIAVSERQSVPEWVMSFAEKIQ